MLLTNLEVKIELDLLKEFIEKRMKNKENISTEDFLFAIEDYKMNLIRRDEKNNKNEQK